MRGGVRGWGRGRGTPAGRAPVVLGTGSQGAANGAPSRPGGGRGREEGETGCDEGRAGRAGPGRAVQLHAVQLHKRAKICSPIILPHHIVSPYLDFDAEINGWDVVVLTCGCVDQVRVERGQAEVRGGRVGRKVRGGRGRG